MIFISENENGVLAWRLVLEGRKTVTRRMKPVVVCNVLAVQPGRGKKAVAHVRVLSCERHSEWYAREMKKGVNEPGVNQLVLQKEAELEGFGSWMDLCGWFFYKGYGIEETFRIEFELVKESKVR